MSATEKSESVRDEAARGEAAKSEAAKSEAPAQDDFTRQLGPQGEGTQEPAYKTDRMEPDAAEDANGTQLDQLDQTARETLDEI